MGEITRPSSLLLFALMSASLSISELGLADDSRPTTSAAATSPAEHHVAVDNVCAWPNLTPLADGTIVAAIFNQPTHGTSAGSVDLWATTDGRRWEYRSTPAPHEPDTNRMNVAVGLAADGDLIVMSSGWSNSYPEGETGAPFRARVVEPWVCRSNDGGRTWAVDKRALPAESPCGGPVIPYGDIIPTHDGQLLVSATSWEPAPKGKRVHRVYVYRSKDDGKTWSDPALVTPFGAEADIFHVGKGRWLSAVRADGIALYVSDDDGRHWHHESHIAKLPEGSPRFRLTPADFLLLSDGRLLVAYGDRRDDQPRGKGVDVQISDDKGRTWSLPARLVDFTGDGGYPSCVQLPDGRIMTAYYARQTDIHDRYHMGVAIWDLRLMALR